MSYAYVTNNVPKNEQAQLPDTAKLLSDPGIWITGLPYQPISTQQATGWFQVVATARPPDTTTHTTTRSLTMVNGYPTETWVSRPWAQDELDSQNREENSEELKNDIEANIDVLIALVDEIANFVQNTANSTINANPAAFIKDRARDLKSAIKQTINIARVTTGTTDSTYSGAP